MESISRNVVDLSDSERAFFEATIGHPLAAGQQVIVQVLPAGQKAEEASPEQTLLKEWAILSDMSETEAAEIEAAILDRSPSRDCTSQDRTSREATL